MDGVSDMDDGPPDGKWILEGHTIYPFQSISHFLRFELAYLRVDSIDDGPPDDSVIEDDDVDISDDGPPDDETGLEDDGPPDDDVMIDDDDDGPPDGEETLLQLLL